jgi:tripartite-type tricarboxylate transporter receptor subunit TctC
LPRGIAERLNAEVVKALHAPDVEARLRQETIDTKSLDAAAFTEFFKAEAQRWTPWAKAVAAQMKASEAPQ